MAQQQAIVADGCFWCTEAVMKDVIGVSKVESGYIGGDKPDPTYKEVCTGNTGHAEGVRVTFDDLEEHKRPASADPSFTGLWSAAGGAEDMVQRVVQRWRAQGR